MRVVILGGAGFIGSNLALALNQLGYEVIIYDLPNSNRKQEFINRGIQYFDGNYLLGKDFGDIIRKNDIIIHLVSTSIPNASNKDVMQDATNNILPSLELIKVCAEKEVGKLIFSSSGGTVYGMPEYLPIDEKHKTDPTSAYGVHKLAIEKYMQLAHSLYNIPVNIMRISNPYGPGQIPYRGQGVIPTFIASIFSDKEIQIWGDGNAIRDYIYIDDLVNAIILLIESKIELDIFNIGSGQGVSVNSILQALENRINRTVKVDYVDCFISALKTNVLDCKKANEILSWNPSISLETGLDKMIQTWDKDIGEFNIFKKR